MLRLRPSQLAAFALVPVAALMATVAEAVETGDLRGRITDEAGGPVGSAEVILSGSSLAGEMSAVSGDDGTFRFINVPVGSHQILIIGEGFQPIRMNINVRLGEATYVPVSLAQTTTPNEEIIVEAVQPVIDSTKSSFNTELTDDFIQALPVGRSFQDAVNMLPGVYGRTDTSEGGPGDGNPSVRGEGQYGNNFLVDGVSTRDPATKTFGTDVNFDAIKSIQVYTDGAPAEYGEFAGMLVNVVTKDGGDEHHGTAGYWFSINASPGKYKIVDLALHEEVPTSKRQFMTHALSLTAGGPIVKERLWYFAAADFSWNRTVFEGGDKNFPLISKGGSLLAKFTFFATPDLKFQYEFNGDILGIGNFETSAQITPEAQSRRFQYGHAHIGHINWRPDAFTELELKGGGVLSRLDHVPMSGDHDTPNVNNLETGEYLQNWTDFDYNRRGRYGGALTFTRLFENLGGDHKLKAGVEAWVTSEARKLEYTGPGGGASYNSAPDLGFPCTSPDYQDCMTYTEYHDAGWLGHKGLFLTGFIQDDWQPVRTLTINAGFRIDRESLFQNAKDPVVMDDPDTLDNPDTPDVVENVEEIPYRMYMPAPRIGIAWDPTGDGKTHVSAFGGMYYDIAGNGLAQWADTKSAAWFTEYTHEDALPILGLGCLEPAEDGSPYCVTWDQDPTGHPLIYSSKLKPARLDKLTVGFEREIIPHLALGIRGILSQTKNLPEDVNTDDTSWFIQPTKQKQRNYKAVELIAERKFDGVWQLLASYTLSESRGTNPGQFETASGHDIGSDGNNVGVLFDDVNDPDIRALYFDLGFGWYLQGLNGLGTVNDPAGYNGYLPYHTFHAIKINGSYMLPFGLNFGLVYEFDSGHAWQKRTLVTLYGDYYGFKQGRGTRFMPPINYIDFRLGYHLDLSKGVEANAGRGLDFAVDVFNIADLRTPNTYYENDDENFGLVLYRQAPRSLRLSVKGTY